MCARTYRLTYLYVCRLIYVGKTCHFYDDRLRFQRHKFYLIVFLRVVAVLMCVLHGDECFAGGLAGVCVCVSMCVLRTFCLCVRR